MGQKIPILAISGSLRQSSVNSAFLQAAVQLAPHSINIELYEGMGRVVGSGEFVGKPVCLFNTSNRANIAYESLKEVLKTMDAKIISDPSQLIPLPYPINRDQILSNLEISSRISSALEKFVIHLT